MKVYIVCRSWADSYEDHGWEIIGTFKDEAEAAALVNTNITETSKDSSNEFYYDQLEVK